MSIEEINDAASEWVFETNGMKWSNNDDSAGDNYGSFIAGVKWLQEKLSNEKDFATEYKNSIEDYLKDEVKKYKDVKVVVMNKPDNNVDI
jgi:hypothetical protein